MKFVANWKMYKTEAEALLFIEQILPKLAGKEAYIAAPFIALSALCKKANRAHVHIGAQNMSQYLEGAYTGEISPVMLKEIGVEFVIIGHSERRHIFKESDQVIFEKIVAALSQGIMPILCVGEHLHEREKGETKAVLRRQIMTALHGLDISPKRIMIAYEPVWAIGTGMAATADMAEEAQAYIRSIIEEMIGKNLAQSLTILYGGSVKPENAKELASKPNVNGFLVGGASLEVGSFLSIIHNAGV
jgi:triosephosphate isomerase